jgi:hypothetical protein
VDYRGQAAGEVPTADAQVHLGSEAEGRLRNFEC